MEYARYAMPLEEVGRVQGVVARCAVPMGWIAEATGRVGAPAAAALAKSSPTCVA
ncbi:hypothetical protein ACRAWG_24720 [Methylobacterium sp. P31]